MSIWDICKAFYLHLPRVLPTPKATKSVVVKHRESSVFLLLAASMLFFLKSCLNTFLNCDIFKIFNLKILVLFFVKTLLKVCGNSSKRSRQGLKLKQVTRCWFSVVNLLYSLCHVPDSTETRPLKQQKPLKCSSVHQATMPISYAFILGMHLVF